MNNEERNYFKWISHFIDENRYIDSISYSKLIEKLYLTEFTYIIPRDVNREVDGINLREEYGININAPCTMLEMMVALSRRCENIMNDPRIGDRTSEWFWNMITNLGLGHMHEQFYDEEYIDDVLDTFMHREYSSDGKGGLFTVPDPPRDMRDVEIWFQLLWYLDTIT